MHFSDYVTKIPKNDLPHSTPSIHSLLFTEEKRLKTTNEKEEAEKKPRSQLERKTLAIHLGYSVKNCVLNFSLKRNMDFCLFDVYTFSIRFIIILFFFVLVCVVCTENRKKERITEHEKKSNAMQSLAPLEQRRRRFSSSREAKQKKQQKSVTKTIAGFG